MSVKRCPTGPDTRLDSRRFRTVQFVAPSFDSFKFGFAGIRARYRDKPRRLLRCIDPFSCELVEFATPLQYENWLLRRFDSSVIYLDPGRDTWEVLHGGRHLEVKPHLHWSGWSDKGFLEIVAEPGQESRNAALDALEIIAHAHGLAPVLRIASQIRAEPKLLDFLDRTRQSLALRMPAMRDPVLRRTILSALNSTRYLRRGELMSMCGQSTLAPSEDTFDAVAFWLRQTGFIGFDLAGGRYDAQTVISLA